ncbi:hypothetical protein MSAN_00270400 [Mycena sanguinolenta]|uniref:Uncharacterized protein n=1 Tax=Mycena sanguinolenta TaxID=230812 RepID=A0A8H6ZGA2_9AGAR|nr:hypothetical protein MSAN_00270400 [Mycena sanguinolenta]
MKLISHTLVTLALYALSSSAVPATSPANALEKRAENCKITGNLARCRRSASTSATIFGEFAAGTTHSFSCWTIGSDGNIWDRTTITLESGKVNCFVSDTLVAGPCPSGLPEC